MTYIDLGVLVVDDDDLTRKMLVRHLEAGAAYLGANLTIYQAADADTAWQLWKANKGRIHGVVTDMILAVGSSGIAVNGVQLLTEIRKDIPNGSIPAIIITSLNDPYNMDRMWTYAQVVPKPMPPHFYKACAWWLSSLNSFWVALEASEKTVIKPHDELAESLAGENHD